MTTQTQNKMYTVDEVATILNYSKRRVQNLVKSGELKSITTNKTETRSIVRIPRTFLIEYLKTQNPEMQDQDLAALIR